MSRNAPAPLFSRIVLQPLEQFLRLEAASGIVLILVAGTALIWANSPWAASYTRLWHAPLPVQDMLFWINDGLMTLFFLVVGLEIRREMHDGSLRTVRLAALPVLAAVGGVVAPALIYLAISREPALRDGWAVPTATDIAFAVGVLALLGKRVPSALRVLLLALAIIDDIVAVLIIALFYSHGVDFTGLLIAAGGVGVVLLFQKLRIDLAPAYLLPGAIVWMGLLKAGIHPTLAGVVLGLLTPIARLAGSRHEHGPAQRVQHVLHPWVAYGVMPLFALANAGVSFGGLDLSTEQLAMLASAVALALFLGKPLGIGIACLLAVKLRWASLPEGADWRGVLLVGCLGGIGFTMSIFIANLAFTDELLSAAKLAVLIASGLSALAGLGVGWMLLGRLRVKG